MVSPFKIGVKLELVDSPAEIHKKINKEIAKVINRNLALISDSVQKEVRSQIGEIFYNSQEYIDILQTGRGEFGFPSGSEKSRMRAIIQGLQQTLIVTPKRVSLKGSNFTGGFLVEAFPDDFNYILALPEAKVTTEKGETITWLFNMLFSGDRIIIADYDVEFGNTGRSGIAHMVNKSGEAWRVPPNLAGVSGDNWITRTVDVTQKYIERIIEDSITNVFVRFNIR